MKSLILDPDPHCPKMLDPDPHMEPMRIHNTGIFIPLPSSFSPFSRVHTNLPPSPPVVLTTHPVNAVTRSDRLPAGLNLETHDNGGCRRPAPFPEPARRRPVPWPGTDRQRPVPWLQTERQRPGQG
jgi:hypothetical protein